MTNKNITDETYLKYLDGILTSNEKDKFEEELKNNPEIREKLEKFTNTEDKLNRVIESYNLDIIPSDILNNLDEVDNLQRNTANLTIKNSILNFVQNMFKPLWEIPIQAKGVVVALPVCVYVFVTTFVPIQIASNQSTGDFFMQLNTKKEFQQFLPNSEYGNAVAVNLNDKSWNIEDITTSFKTRSAAQASGLTCANNLDNKIIEIFPTDNPLNKRTLTYCSVIDKNNWRLLNIEIKKDEKPLKLNSNYKLVFEKDSIFLFPQDSE
jgi:hypothetical protein